jgi:hypothetical protein
MSKCFSPSIKLFFLLDFDYTSIELTSHSIILRTRFEKEHYHVLQRPKEAIDNVTTPSLFSTTTTETNSNELCPNNPSV